MAERRRITRTPRVGSPKGQRARRTVDLTWQATEQALRAQAEVEKAGLVMGGNPEGESPELPDDPTALDDSQLMTLFTQYVAWADYCATHLAFAEVDERLCAQMLEEKKDLLLLRLMPTSEALRKREETMTKVKAEVDTHQEVVELQAEYFTAHARRKLLSTTFDRYDRDGFLLSRELTRRTGGQDPKQRRVNRWGV